MRTESRRRIMWLTLIAVGVLVSSALLVAIRAGASSRSGTSAGILSADPEPTAVVHKVRPSSGAGTKPFDIVVGGRAAIPFEVTASGFVSSLHVRNLRLVGYGLIDSPDLTISLRSPAGTTVDLVRGLCTATDAKAHDVFVTPAETGFGFSDSATLQVGANGAPRCTGTGGRPRLRRKTFKPVEALSAFEGESMTGTWKLLVTAPKATCTGTELPPVCAGGTPAGSSIGEVHAVALILNPEEGTATSVRSAGVTGYWVDTPFAFINHPERWTIPVANFGSTPDSNRVIRVSTSRGLFVPRATIGGIDCDSTAHRTVICTVPTIPALGVLDLKLTAWPVRRNAQSFTVEVVGSDDGVDTRHRSRRRAIRVGGKSCTVIGTMRSETLRGTSGRDVMCGLGGRDRLLGRGGADVLYGNSGGRSTIVAIERAGRGDTLVGGRGNDVMTGWSGDVVSYRDLRGPIRTRLARTYVAGDTILVTGHRMGTDRLVQLEGTVEGTRFADTIETYPVTIRARGGDDRITIDETNREDDSLKVDCGRGRDIVTVVNSEDFPGSRRIRRCERVRQLRTSGEGDGGRGVYHGTGVYDGQVDVVVS